MHPIALAFALTTATPEVPATPLPPVIAEERAPEEDARRPERRKQVDLDELRQRRAATDIAEALSELPGVIARQRYNEAQDTQIQVRGFGARSPFGVRGLRIEYDGIPATAADGQSQIGHLDIASGGRMTLVRGPFAALYGNGGAYLRVDGVRGVQRDGDRVSLALGSNGQRRIGIAADTGEALRLGVSGNHYETDGVRARSAATRTLGAARLDWEIGERDALALSLHTQVQPDSEDPQGLTRAEFDADPEASNPLAAQFGTRKSARQSQLGARWQHDFGDSELSFAAYAGQRSIDQVLSVSVQAQQLPTNGGGIVDLERDYHGWSLRWLHRAAWSFADAELSAELRDERLAEDRRGYENFVGDRLGVRGALRRDETNASDARDAMLRLDLMPGDAWRFSAGVRRTLADYRSDDRFIAPGNPDDSGDYSADAWLPVVGASWRIDPQWQLHAAVGRTQELPTLAELAYREDGDGGFNDDLKPAMGDQAELGLAWAGDALRAELTAFLVEMDDEIVVDSALGGRTSFRNAGATRRDGLEIAADWRLAQAWQLRGVANLIDARYREGYSNCPARPLPCPPQAVTVAAGQPLTGVPDRSARVELGYTAGRDWSAALEWQALSPTPASDRVADKVPGYAIWNLRWQKRFALRGFGLASALVRVDNLFDRRYSASAIVNDGARRYYETAPGRSVWVGVDWAW
ncbi:MAG: TonB-dependent receptor [Rhodanobacteraceae bacterium]|nr:TonB-dependent receptor [Rhodanobacteraceae bacterium]